MTQLGEGKCGIGSNGRAEYDGRYKLGIEVDNAEVRNNKVRKKDQKVSKSKNWFKFKKLSMSKKIVESLDFIPLKLN